MPITSSPFRDEYLDGPGETPFHVITKYKHTTDLNLMVRVAKMLIEKKFTASMKDRDGYLAIDFIDVDTQKSLYDVLAKVTWSKYSIKGSILNIFCDKNMQLLKACSEI